MLSCAEVYFLLNYPQWLSVQHELTVLCQSFSSLKEQMDRNLLPTASSDLEQCAPLGYASESEVLATKHQRCCWWIVLNFGFMLGSNVIFEKKK